MLAARRSLKALPGIGFHKLLGSGTREGFHPFPNFGVYGILATWPSLEDAQAQIESAPVFQRYRDHAVECCTVYLSSVRCRGQWAGVLPFDVGDQPLDTPTDSVAVLTRATIKPRHVIKFWSQVPNISTTIRHQDQLEFKIGLGEVPWLHQVTFTIWENKAAMDAFAYRQWHGEAVQAVRAGGWFSEELFARFRVLQLDGQWEGQHPLVNSLKTANK
ncbi:MAG: spheroidene monooxygenase [Alphaproteobacteria bacterium]|nr:spheroidene monooxygenase [Alphaproteobacteria bacterium]